MEQDLCRKKARMFMIERVYKSDNSSVKVYELTLHTPAFEDTNFMPIRGNKSRKRTKNNKKETEEQLSEICQDVHFWVLFWSGLGTEVALWLGT